jgi:hypothetical protein
MGGRRLRGHPRLVASPTLAETTVEHRFSNRTEYLQGLDLTLARIGFQRTAADDSTPLVYRHDRPGPLRILRGSVRVMLGTDSATLTGPRRTLSHLGG